MITPMLYAGYLKEYDFVKSKKPCLVLEPGVAMAANALSFITKVVSKKESAGIFS